MNDFIHYAPGWPGIPPRWTSSAKTGAGTALNQHSKVWFTTSHGILNEVYFPRVDQACTRDLGFIVTNGRDFFSEEKRHCTFENKPFEPGVPAYELTNTDGSGRYRIHKEILTDPYRNVVLQKIRFEPLQGQLSDYRLYALLSPHLANCGNAQHRLGGRLQRRTHVPRRARRHRIRPGLIRALEKNVRRIRRCLRRMAGSFRSLPDGVGIPARREWQHRLHRRDRSRRLQWRVRPGPGFRSIVDRGRAASPLHFARRLLDELREHYVFHWKNWQNTSAQTR
jgi:hypothetical protein